MKRLLTGETLDGYVARNLSRFFPGLRTVGRHRQISKGRTIDVYAKDVQGTEYYIEVKATDCNRLNIGQAVEYKAQLARVNPSAKMILICRRADADTQQILHKIGIQVRTFADLGIPEDKDTEYETRKPLSLKLSPIEQKAYFALLRKGNTIAKVEDLSSAIDVPDTWAKNILSKLVKHGAAYRLGRGKYAIVPADVIYGRKSYVADPLILASELMKDKEYYVAYQSAAQIHGIAEQVPFRTTVAVLKQKRPMKVGDALIRFVTVKRSKFFGLEEVEYSNILLKVSDLQKTIVDCIDRQDMCGGIAEVSITLSNALATGNLNWDKLASYVGMLKNHAIAQRLGFLLESHARVRGREVTQNALDRLWQLAGPHTYPLDTKAPKKGKISKRWRIIENAAVF